MAINFKKIWEGLGLVPKTTSTSDSKGELEVLDSSGKLNYHNGTSNSPVVTEAHSATLTNKTLTSPVINSPTGIVKGDVGLGNVDNTSDADKPISTATQTALNLKQDASSAVTLTGVQTLTNKTLTAPVINSPTGIVKADVGLGNVDNTSDANKPVSTAQQTALDLKANLASPTFTGTVSGITAAMVGLGNVDNTSDATKNAAVATLTNKTITGADFRTPVRSDVKQDTLANLVTYASTASNGQLVFATDTKQMFQVVDSNLVAVGSGAGGLDVAFSLFAEEQVSTWSTGDNATFLGGGTLAGTFIRETAAPLHGNASYKYTQAAGSLDDYIASPAQPIDIRFRGNVATLTFPYLYDGASSDIEPVIWDATNSVKLNVTTNLLPSTGTNTSIYRVNITIPSTCTSIRFGFQVKALNSGKILQFDDVVLSADSTVYADPSTVTEWQSYTPTYTGFGTVSASEMQWRRVGSDVEIRGKFNAGTNTGVEARMSLPSSYVSAGTSVIPSLQLVGDAVTGAASSTYFRNTVLIEPAVSYVTFGVQGSAVSAISKTLGTGFTNGTSISLFAKIPIAGLSASNPQIITASESFSTDTAQLTYASSAAYTLSTLANAPVGTFITFTYAINTNTRTQTTTAPTQTTSDMSVNGIQVFSRAYNAASTAGNPAVVAIQVGKRFKGLSLGLYKSIAKVNAGSIDFIQESSTTQYGLSLKEYNESTGILTIDAGYALLSSNAVNRFTFSDLTTQTNGYLVINASKSPALVGVPQLQQRIATISDVKASGTAGGTATSGSYQTRTLNTLSDPTGIVTSLSSNQFTLPAGEYFIEGTAPAYWCEQHKTKIRNITDSTDAILGSSEYIRSAGGAANSAQSSTRSSFSGTITISSSKAFELQHRVSLTVASEGYGVASSFGESEVYSILKITKVK
jgi:hypothetical protein